MVITYRKVWKLTYPQYFFLLSFFWNHFLIWICFVGLHNNPFFIDNIPANFLIVSRLHMCTKNLSAWLFRAFLCAVKTIERLKAFWLFHIFIKLMDLILSFINIYKVFTNSIWKALWMNNPNIVIVWNILWITIVHEVSTNSYLTIVFFVLIFCTDF